MATKFENVMNEDVRTLKDVERRFRKRKHTKEHIKNDSDGYIVEKFLKILNLSQIYALTFWERGVLDRYRRS